MTSANRRPVLRRVLLWTALVVFFGLCAVIMLGLIGAQSGVTATALGAVLSVVVVGIVVPVFLWLDRFEREPTGLLIFAFLWGACAATLGAAVLNDVGGYLLGSSGDSNASVAVTVAPIVEESMKGLGPLLILLFRRREVDGIVDGMVYAGLTAAGFAAVEDVVYLANGYNDHGDQGLVGTFVVRVLMSPFAHPMFTICTGIGIGIAAVSGRWFVRLLAPLAGWGCAVMLHATWNAAAVLSERGWLATYVGLQIPLFAAFVTLVVLARRREARQIGIQLSPYVDAGWLSTAEVRMLSSMPERRYARAWAQSHGGKPTLKQMREFQDAASELAMLHRRLSRQHADAAMIREERSLLAIVSERRQQFLGTALYRWPGLS